MRLQASRSKNATSLYIVKSIYEPSGKRSNVVVKKLGTVAELSKVHDDPYAWGREEARRLTLEEQTEKARIAVSYCPGKRIPPNQDALKQGGYLFLQKLYTSLRLDRICEQIAQRHAFDYDLNDILKALIFGRILFPASKAATYDWAQSLLETPSFQRHDVYRALDVLAEENDFIQSELYKQACDVLSRRDDVLYYDCTNFFFEIEEEEGLKQYGQSKEHRPNPIVQMGLFMDADGLPLAFSIQPGNQNEQKSLKPLERKIIHDFGKARFVVCTDAGLASTANRRFNDIRDRAFITVQSLKKMKGFQQAWALDPDGWQTETDPSYHNLETIRSSDALQEKYANTVFYKERWFNEGGLEQRYIVTFSLKYRAYEQQLRSRQLERAEKIIQNQRFRKKSPNSPERFLEELYIDDDGTLVERSDLLLNQELARREATFDGFYCVATNLDGPVAQILKINRQRWEIEENFRILKHEFKARPVYLSRDNRITAHFVTCFLALFLFRVLEQKLHEAFTAEEIVKTLRSMAFIEARGEGYIPAYRRSDLTDALHEAFGFNTDYEIVSLKLMRSILRETKKH